MIYRHNKSRKLYHWVATYDGGWMLCRPWKPWATNRTILIRTENLTRVSGASRLRKRLSISGRWSDEKKAA